MSKLLLLLTPFLLGNSAGGLGGLLVLVVTCIIAVGAVIAILWGLAKWLL